MSLRQRVKAFALAHTSPKSPASNGPHLFRAGGESLDPGRNKAEKPLDRVERPGLSVRQQQPAGHRIEPFQILEQACDLGRVLALPVVKQHVAAKVRVAAEDLVRSFSGQDDLVAGVAHGAAQQVFGDAVGIEAERLRLRDRIGKMIGQIVLPDRDGEEFRAGLRRHLPGFSFLVIFGAVEGQGEGANRFAVMSRRQAEDRTGVEPAAEVAADRNVGAQTDANRLFQREAELRGVVGIGTLGVALRRLSDSRNPNIGCTCTCLSVAIR